MFDWSKQVILLTGGTGSFGQAFTEELLHLHPPKALRIFSRDEYKQHEMQKRFQHPSLRYFIGDVRDRDRLKRAMHDVTLVIHAAAMKQIVASEYNPREAIFTNILGAINILDTAIDMEVPRIISLGTDKAVIPINLYGATKLCAEKLFIQGNVYTSGKTLISCVRYGNVAASRGSIIPLFLEQRNKGVLTVTDEAMTRFWITIHEAVQFVMNTAQIMRGGEIFIPKMPSFRIIDLARILAPKARIKIVGMRPGEKIHEDLIVTHETNRTYDAGKQYIIFPIFPLWEKKLKTIGKKVVKNFTYNSGTNSEWLSLDHLSKQLKKIIK